MVFLGYLLVVYPVCALQKNASEIHLNPGVSWLRRLYQCHVSYRHPEKDAEQCFQDGKIASIFFIFPDFSLFYHILSILGLPFCTPYLATVIKLNESHAS